MSVETKMKRLNSHKYNILLVKDDVGKPKPTTRRLPYQGFTFGKAEIRDPEDAGQGKLDKPGSQETAELLTMGS